MPNGEEAYILIMEHIRGSTMPEWLAHYKEAKASKKVELLQSLKDIVSLVVFMPHLGC